MQLALYAQNRTLKVFKTHPKLFAAGHGLIKSLTCRSKVKTLFQGILNLNIFVSSICDVMLHDDERFKHVTMTLSFELSIMTYVILRSDKCAFSQGTSDRRHILQ